MLRLTIGNMLAELAFVCLAMAQSGSGVSPPHCPLCIVEKCENVTLVQASCPGAQLVNDWCGCCRECGRVFGESCGGEYGYLGKCEYRLECTADSSEFLNGVNVSGICTSECITITDNFCYCTCGFQSAYLSITVGEKRVCM